MAAVAATYKHRNQTADLMKGIAVVLMVQVHIMELFATQQVYDSILGKISLFLGGPPCAPVFMAVMGFFLVSENKSSWHLVRRGLLLFSGGILLNIGLNAHFLLNIFSGTSDADAFTYIFGADILPLAGLSVMVIAALRKIFKKYILLYFILTVAVVFVSPYLPVFAEPSSTGAYINAFLWGMFEWSYFPLLPWVAYVLAGYAFRLACERFDLKNKFTISHAIVFVIPFSVAFAFTVPYVAGIAYNLKGEGGYYHHGILFFACMILFFGAYILWTNIFEEYTGKNFMIRFLKWTGRNVTVFYVFQWLIIGNLATTLYRTQEKGWLILWFAGIIFVSAILTYIFESLKGSRIQKMKEVNV